MVVAYAGRDIGQKTDGLEYARADQRMLAHDLPLLWGQRSGLQMIASGMPIFPMSCKRPAR